MVRPARHSIHRILVLLALWLVPFTGCERAGSWAPLHSPGVDAAPSLFADSLGPLRVCAENPRYFRRGDRVQYLTGSHTWNTFQDWGPTDPPPAFDYGGYLDFLTRAGHNFIRLYVWEQAAWFPGEERKIMIAPLAYERTGPGEALDGGLRFDLARFNPAYFERLRRRVAAAGERGIYVSVMLFDGWSVERKGQTGGNPWRGHPLNGANNVNGIDGDRDGDGEGKEIHTLQIPEVTEIQKAYVRKVVETVGDFDNVLWEISNESHGGSVAWQYAMIHWVRKCESARGWSHPVGMTTPWPEAPEGNACLWDSPADWISPHDNAAERYCRDPLAATGRKVVLVDTDHIWGVGGSPKWVWESLTHGLNPLFMDPYVTALRNKLPAWPPEQAGSADLASSRGWEDVRRTMGYARYIADDLPLASMAPRGELASTGFCLAAPGAEYLVYLPEPAGRGRRLVGRLGRALGASSCTVDLSSVRGDLTVEWIDAGRGRRLIAAPVSGGRSARFRAPCSLPALLHLKAVVTP